MSASIDLSIRANLQLHLRNVNSKNYEVTPKALTIGSLNLLESAVKISSSDAITHAFMWNGELRDFPTLPKRNYVVACIHPFIGAVQVKAVYSDDHMKEVINHCKAGYAKYIQWRAMEISEELEAELLQGVKL